MENRVVDRAENCKNNVEINGKMDLQPRAKAASYNFFRTLVKPPVSLVNPRRTCGPDACQRQKVNPIVSFKGTAKRRETVLRGFSEVLFAGDPRHCCCPSIAIRPIFEWPSSAFPWPATVARYPPRGTRHRPCREQEKERRTPTDFSNAETFRFAHRSPF